MKWLPLLIILPYFILLLRSYKNLLILRNFKIQSEPGTFVSVIVPCYNEEDSLPTILDCLLRQTYSPDLFEVIVVNDNSTDHTGIIAENFRGISNYHAVNNDGQGKKMAILSGIKASRGKLIITTDADCSMGTDWIRTIAAFYEYNRPDLIICPVKLNPSGNFFGNFQALEFLSLQGVTAGFSGKGQAILCNGANLAFPVESYLKHCEDLHFEHNSGDDIFLLQSIKKEKGSVIQWLESPDAAVITQASRTLNSFLAQRRRWISKIKSYRDRYTIISGIVIITAVLLQAVYFCGSFIIPPLVPVFITVLIIKSIPDYLIINKTAVRYGMKGVMRWFLPVQIIYPFYVLSVIISGILSRR